MHGSGAQNLNSNEGDPALVTGGPITTVGVIKSKERKKHDRFNGMSEEEVAKRELPDHLCDNLDIVIVSVNFCVIHTFFKKKHRNGKKKTK